MSKQLTAFINGWIMPSACLMLVWGSPMVHAIEPMNLASDLEVEQCLDLRGTWKGVLIDELGRVLDVELAGNKLKFTGRPCPVQPESVPLNITDEGRGRIRIKESHFWTLFGLYRHERNHLLIYFREASKGRPEAFPIGKPTVGGLFILHRR